MEVGSAGDEQAVPLGNPAVPARAAERVFRMVRPRSPRARQPRVGNRFVPIMQARMREGCDPARFRITPIASATDMSGREHTPVCSSRDIDRTPRPRCPPKPRSAIARARCGRPTFPFCARARTSSAGTRIPMAWSRLTIAWRRTRRASRVASRNTRSPGFAGIDEIAENVELHGSPEGAELDAADKDQAGRVRRVPCSSKPSTVSWSVTLSTSMWPLGRPCTRAGGVSRPSEAVVWRCRSISHCRRGPYPEKRRA